MKCAIARQFPLSPFCARLLQMRKETDNPNPEVKDCQSAASGIAPRPF